MKIYTYSEARQNLSSLLNCAENEEVVIKRRDGKTFTVFAKPISSSPFDKESCT
ncbi:MAG: type II toxin-antitoxin system Phd/YefM family antitoxin [Gammaproteobacteria bacterium]|nr:type II toxin-antitoxin system Phd/YefM family antitoxin [Gammaproteobacteria bacterium]